MKKTRILFFGFLALMLTAMAFSLNVKEDLMNRGSPDVETPFDGQDFYQLTDNGDQAIITESRQEEVSFIYVGNDNPFRTVITPYGMLPLIIELEYPTLDFAYDKHTRESVSESNPMKTNLAGKGTNYDYQKWGLSDKRSPDTDT